MSEKGKPIQHIAIILSSLYHHIYQNHEKSFLDLISPIYNFYELQKHVSLASQFVTEILIYNIAANRFHLEEDSRTGYLDRLPVG